MLYNILKANVTSKLGEYAKKRFMIFRWTNVVLNLGVGLLLFIPATVVSVILSMTEYNEVIEIYYRKRNRDL